MKQIAHLIDHTLLKPEATPGQVEALCAEALSFGFASVCVNGSYVPLCARLLAGSAVAVCTVIGFPLGAMSTAAKVFEAEDAVRSGAREVDMVLAIGRLRAGEAAYVLQDIAAVAQVVHGGGALLKVILETALLDEAQKELGARLAVEGGADFVKTSTGFGGGGATIADVALLRRVVGQGLGVKASGGIRSLADAQAMVTAGATRLGTSAGVTIVAQAGGEQGTGSGGTY